MNGQDAFGLRRQQRAVAALARGFFTQEIVPVTITDRRGVKPSSIPTSISGPMAR